MEGNVYPEKTAKASEKFSLGETIPRMLAPMLVYMGKTKDISRRFFFREWAKVAGKRQSEVARFTGLNKSFISLLWSGQKEPSTDTQAQIADCLGVPPVALQMHPGMPHARAVAALGKLSKEQQETAVGMLEGLAAIRQ